MKSGWLKRGLEDAANYVKSNPYLYASCIMSRIGYDICKPEGPQREGKIEFQSAEKFAAFVKFLKERSIIENKELINIKN